MDIHWEPIGGGLSAATTAACRLSADALLLAAFATPSEDDRVCDLGTGNGILPLLWCRRRSPQHIAAVERQAAFADLAKAAVEKHHLENTVQVYCCDWADEAAMPPSRSMTLVTCNPPYFPFGGARQNADPLRTAARHEDAPDLLDTLCRAAKRLLAENGRFCLCHRPERLADVTAALSAAGFSLRRLQHVHQTEKSDAWLVLIEAAASGTLRILPPLIQQPLGDHTAVYKRLYK